MHIFKKYTYTWQEIAIFKLALLALGVVMGAYWHEFWSDYLAALIVVAVVASAYIMYVSYK